MKIEGDCPHCKNAVAIDIEKLEVKQPQNTLELKNASTTQNTVQVQKIEEPKVTIKTVAPKDQPFFRCKDCDDKHPNPNYKVRPNKKCPNCGSLNGEKACKNCNKKTNDDDWEELDDDALDEMEIPRPETPKHNHNHEDD